ncbi:PREDICTED: protein downstream neighbor of Son-like isoform X2 [Nicotiana attenuata]|uniref:protein downstream neighbor of Son-like isoform X2 n=1 Tax=Nicotiana attenuata TaxID=49451 RepID=UPI00090464E3|nr:PREDICTED: protein downstream neighbor of Son-like isoform X2 [Nicotiana attenuata]
MAKVAAGGPVHPSNALKFGGGGGSKVTTTTVKRKTPSELRGEQLKRKNTMQLVDESSAPIGGSLSNGVFPGPKRSDVSKNPKYIDTRVDELFPVRKNSIRLNLISRKENVKESFPAEQSGSIKKSSVPSAFPAENQQQLKCGKDCATKTCSTSQRCNENTFRSVTELSLGGVDAHGLSTIDMDKALRGLATHEHQVASAKIAESSEPDGGSRSKNFSSELHVPCKMTPLDLTMKTNIRVVSASSINWFHRLINCCTSNVVARFTSLNCSTSQKMTCFPEMNSVSQAVNHWSLHSWMYPQSPLPPSVISTLTLSASTGGQLNFLSERQLAWQDSFRSLYYMLRKNVCSIFYVCTAQFVVMFTSSYSEENCVCNAYISQSTRGLRLSLKEHDVSFSMPLCRSKLEELSTEELLELSEIEKQNPGQTRRRGAMSDVDNRPQSLLAFTGNKNVHSLYDFLLNYRYFLTSLTGVDVPVLYSPIPFENAAFTAPEVRCKEVRRIDQVGFQGMESNVPCEHNQQPSSGMCYSVEIKGRYLAPWVTSAICDAFSSNSTCFEASFITEPTSVGLNTCLSVSGKCSDPQVSATEALDNGSLCFGIPNTKLCAQINSAFLKGVKYFGGSYTAFLSPV